MFMIPGARQNVCARETALVFSVSRSDPCRQYSAQIQPLPVTHERILI